MTQPDHPEHKKLNLSWKWIAFLFLIGFAMVVGFSYIMFLQHAKSRMFQLKKKAEKILPEINAYFTEEEDAPGNGAAYLMGLVETPGFEKLDGDIDYKADDPAAIIKLITDWLGKNPDWIEKNAKLKEYSRFRFKRDINEGALMLLNELAGIRHLVRVNEEICKFLVKRKRHEEYMDLITSMIHVSDTYFEPIFIAHLVSIALNNITNFAIYRTAGYITEPEKVNRLISLFREDIPLNERMIAANKGELISFGYWLTDINNLANKEFKDLCFPKTDIEKIISFALYRYIETGNLLENYFTVIKLSKLTYPDNKNKCEKMITGFGKYGYILSKQLMQIFPDVFPLNIRAINHRRCTQAVLRIHLFYLENRRLPDTLEEIEYYKQNGIPVDAPYKNPLVYFKSEDPLCFRVKWIGEDQKDSGEWLKPKQNKKTGKYSHNDFGWVYVMTSHKVPLGEYILGIDYYEIESDIILE